MSTAPQNFTQEETLSLIQERANVLKSQEQPAVFDVNLNRRVNGVTQQIASLSDASYEHIVDPLRWVPMLCGGGDYVLNVRHPSSPGRIGGALNFPFPTTGEGMEPRQPDPLVLLRPDWQGPARINHPPMPSEAEQRHRAATRAMAGYPPVPGASVSAPHITSGYGPPGMPPPAQTTAVSERERELTTQLAEMKANTARVEAEAKARAELEAVKREADARVREVEQRGESRMRDLEAKLSALSTQAARPPEPPKQDMLATVSQIFQLFSPFITQILQAQHENRQTMLKLNEDQNRRQLEANEKQHTAMMEMVKAATAKPGMSEEMKMLITTLQTQASQGGNEAMSAMLMRMTEAMGTVSKSSISMVEAAVDALGGEPEHPAVIAIREGTNALKAIIAGNREAAMRTIPKKQPQLPAGQQQQQQQRMPNFPGTNIPMTPEQVKQWNDAARARQAQQQAGKTTPPKPAGPQPVTVSTPPAPPAPTAQPAPAPAAPQTPPVQVVEFKPPAQPAAQPAPAEPAPANLPTIPMQPVGVITLPNGCIEALPGSGLTHFEVLKAGIEALKSPDEVAQYAVDLMKNDERSIDLALEDAGRSPFMLMRKTFGDEFITAHQAYFEQVGALINEKGIEAGLWGDEDGEEGKGDEGDEDTAEAEGAPVDVPVEAPAAPVPPATVTP